MNDKDRNKLQSKIIKAIHKEIEKGRFGEIDYHYDGKKVVRDNITFAREEFTSILKETLMAYDTAITHKKFRS